MSEYKIYLVSYIDLLGIKSMANEFSKLLFIYDLYRKIGKEGQHNWNNKPSKAHMFSDSLIRATLLDGINENQTKEILTNEIKDLAFLQNYLLCSSGAEVLTRGGVTIGKLYFEDNTCFGPALNTAVTLENKIKQPVIQIDKIIVDRYKIETNNHLIQKEGKNYFINFLGLTQRDHPYSLDPEEILKAFLLKNINNIYSERLGDKYRWLIDYYNNFVAEDESWYGKKKIDVLEVIKTDSEIKKLEVIS